MSQELRIMNKRQVKSIASDIIDKQKTVYNYAIGSDVFRELKETVGEGTTFFIDEFLYGCLKESVNEKSKIDLEADQLNLDLSYGEKQIKLPEKHAIKVEYANLLQMSIQKRLLVANYEKQIKAFEKHHDHIVVPIINAMIEHNLLTAGEALRILCKG